MKKLIVVVMLLCFCGCGMPTQQDIQSWTATLDEVVPAVREVVGEDNEKIDKVIDDIEIVKEAVAKAKTPAEAVSKGIEASKPFNPYADEMNAILGLVTVIGGIWAKGKIDEKKKVEDKYSAAKIGMDKFRNANPEKAAELYNDVGEARKAKKIA